VEFYWSAKRICCRLSSSYSEAHRSGKKIQKDAKKKWKYADTAEIDGALMQGAYLETTAKQQNCERLQNVSF